MFDCIFPPPTASELAQDRLPSITATAALFLPALHLDVARHQNHVTAEKLYGIDIE